MKKIIFSVLSVLVLPVIALAYFQPATLTNGINKVVVYSEAQAKNLFSQGFVLDTKVGAVTSNVINSNYFEVNKNGSYVITGKFNDASLTAVSFRNPWGATATATVDLVRLNQTGAATSSYTMACGAATLTTGAPDIAILSSGSVATSTKATLIENNLSAAQGATVNGGSVAKIALNSAYPNFVCTITDTGEGSGSAFTGGANTFDGNFVVRISKNRY